MPAIIQKTKMKLIININYYSLLEMIAVIVLIGILMNAALMLYYNSRKINDKYTEKAVQIKSVSVISKYLRTFVHENGAVISVKPEKVVFGNGSIITAENNRLVFTTNTGKRSFAVPKGFAATFALENNLQEPPCIVLNIFMLDSQKHLQVNKFTHIAACTEGEQK
jgi:prepilin-type N-terminal cleavage/methylation domain-containing protein